MTDTDKIRALLALPFILLFAIFIIVGVVSRAQAKFIRKDDQWL